MKNEGGARRAQDAIVMDYTLNAQMWRRFFNAHYQHQGFFRMRYLYGLVLLVMGALMIGAESMNALVGAAFLLSGLYCVLSKQLFILKSMATARKGPLFEERVEIRLTRESLTVMAASQRSERKWTDFLGYRLVPAGIMLYLDRNAFFFIPQEALTETTADMVRRVLEIGGLKRL